jgi:hypothetical protein
MKIDNIELIRITKTDIETKEGTKEIWSANFEDKEKGIKIGISQDEEFDFVIGEKYSIKIDTEQKKL